MLISDRGVAQATPRMPRPGDRVRIWVADRPHTGVIDVLQSDFVVLHGQPPISLAPIQRLDVAVGRKGHSLEGVGLGFLIGGVVGALAARSAMANEGLDSIGEGLAIWLGVWGGTTVLGRVIGNGMKSDRWQRVVPWPPSSGRPYATPGLGVRPFTAGVRIPVRDPSLTSGRL